MRAVRLSEDTSMQLGDNVKDAEETFEVSAFAARDSWTWHHIALYLERAKS